MMKVILRDIKIKQLKTRNSRVLPLAKKPLIIDSYWNTEKQFSSMKVTLSISTTLLNRPDTQEWVAAQPGLELLFVHLICLLFLKDRKVIRSWAGRGSGGGPEKS